MGVHLLANAAKYQEDNGRIDLSVDDADGVASITVRDRGIGIAPEMLSNVFELFRQGEPTLDRAQGGLGIGLSLAQRLVEMHGGSVTARSAGLGKGSEFVVRLPCRRVTDAVPARAPEAMPEVPRPESRSILVVDDYHDAADSLLMLMNKRGFDPRVAYDGSTALEMAKSVPPSAELLDIGPPCMDSC